MGKNDEKFLRKLYYDKNSHHIYTGDARLLFKAAKKLKPKIKFKIIEKFLQSQAPYILNKPVRLRFPRAHIRGDGIFTCTPLAASEFFAKKIHKFTKFAF